MLIWKNTYLKFLAKSFWQIVLANCSGKSFWQIVLGKQKKKFCCLQCYQKNAKHTKKNAQKSLRKGTQTNF
jgi:hypothetical protein